MKHIVIGMLAHVDAGKTTLSESMLYQSGEIRKLGRVDHGNTFFDFHGQERNRGITIFSKQASLHWKESDIQLLDTPGHVDFSAEMERTLGVLDYAIVIISALDGVQVHTETIWKLLKHYQIPTFLFINKMDISYETKEILLAEMKEKLGDACIDFSGDIQEQFEQIALCDESLLEEYLVNQTIKKEHIKEAIVKRNIFPCFFGSALKLDGIEYFLNALDEYTLSKNYPKEFGAKVYQITHDEHGNRLTHVKITGGFMKAKQVLENGEKVDQLRRYQGTSFQIVQEAQAGEIVTLKGVKCLYANEGLGFEKSDKPILSSYLNYQIIPPKDCDLFRLKHQLEELTQEDPQLHLSIHQDQLQLRLMGKIQIEVIKQLILDRYGIEVDLKEGTVTYLETITEPVEGVGHFEPLRHYAEVHVLLEPLPRGSGIEVASCCSLDILAKNWQNQVLSHIEEIESVGVLVGAPITDIKITLLSGKAHLKHTEGGDFKEATKRAIRHALKRSHSILLEPHYAFRIELPSVFLGKAIYDIEQMHGTFEIVKDDGMMAIISGSASVRKMQNYQQQLYAYTKGSGRFYCSLKGFQECEDANTVVEEIGYDSEKDIEHPTGSIFCSHGAGFYVKWDEVESYMHLPYTYIKKHNQPECSYVKSVTQKVYGEEELEAIFQRTYQTSKGKKRLLNKTEKSEIVTVEKVVKKTQCLLVDGYNMIFSWPELKDLAQENMDAARQRLIDKLGNYQGYLNCLLIVVFDAYQVDRPQISMVKDGTIYVAYTKHAQTADEYIEQATHTLASNYQVKVATSDGAIQLISVGQGAQRISAREFLKEVEESGTLRLKEHQDQNTYHFSQPLADLRKFKEDL